MSFELHLGHRVFAEQRFIARTVQAEGQLTVFAVTNPNLWRDLVSAPIGQAIHRLLLIQAFRPDRLLAMAHVFVSTNLGESFMSIMEQPLDLTHIVDTEVGSVPPAWRSLSSPRRPSRVHAVCRTLGLNPTSPSAGEAKHSRPDVLGARV